MKKIYTLALAAAVAFGASAEVQILKVAENATLPTRTLNAELVEGVQSMKLNAKQQMRAVAAEDVYGTYTWNYLWPSEEPVMYEGEMFYIYATENPEECVLEFDGWQIFADLDLEAGTITTYPQFVMETNLQGTPVELWYYPLVTNDAMELEPKDEVVLSISADGLTMDEYDALGILIMDANSGDMLGLGAGYLLNEFERYIESEHWTDLGEATFVDGYIPSLFYQDATDADCPVSQVLVQRSVADPTVLRAKNAWTASILPLFGENGEGYLSEHLHLNIANAEEVIVPAQEIGISVQGMGSMWVLSTNYCYEYFQDFTDEDFETFGGKYVTLTDNVVNFPTGSLIAFFPEVVDASNVYIKLPGLTTTLTLPAGWDAIENVNVENSEAAVEYYNLQGIRVANPENGIFIRRAGNNVTKVVK